MPSENEAITHAVDAYYLGVQAAISEGKTSIWAQMFVERARRAEREEEPDPLKWQNPSDVGVALFLRSLERDGYVLLDKDKWQDYEP